ncbi:MAG: SpoIIE family protein phosphatase [Candidatus Aminicenantes bacterium]|nr:SpoIIE family protein phosphatase [Candidatus Aminicenantes bacterium]NIM79987.1 SpoIIE family protein phosphatase [Candidatus Aminicenantes bacterium]NIN19339.1 SpoIIE family protein phosphatase [Candidatus Aminicenantes bacterium]NIN43238.1 SpoIIE family protein phosphatase [Candidatus Aminicenantes bacterium]NIN85980.1 SpoIIE family protein phosphatase [Candidatus Aminicenantes bacterium]
MRSLTTYQMVFTTLPAAFGILHFILFIFFKRAKENLYFAFFLFFYGASIFFDYQHIMFEEMEQTMNYIRIHRAMIPIYSIFALRFVYSLFYKKLPRQFRLFLVIFLISGVLDVVFIKGEHGIFFYIAMILFIIEISRVIGTAIHKKRDGAWIAAVGFSIFFFFSIFDTLMDLGVPTLFQQMENPYAIGTFGFVVTMSVYLARNYARTSEQLLQQERQAREQEVQQRLLEEDNTRKTRELEEARQLQLSMLPQCIHDIPGIDVCFHMETAAEVGGDYYDYHQGDDGTLTIAIGDATGHGMKAGIMVSVIKTLFITNAAQTDILSFLNQCNASIKQMQMGNLYMALALVRIKGNKLTVSSAGMPPVLIYRKADQRVEEIMLKSPPLGGFSNFSYRKKETELMPGDTVLLMSDGLPELFNENDEMMGYTSVKRIFKDAALGTPDEIVSHLSAEAERWRNKKAQDDDMTFVALKIDSKA